MWFQMVSGGIRWFGVVPRFSSILSFILSNQVNFLLRFFKLFHSVMFFESFYLPIATFTLWRYPCSYITIRGIFRTQSNICDGAFSLCKKAPSWMFVWALNTLMIITMFIDINIIIKFVIM